MSNVIDLGSMEEKCSGGPQLSRFVILADVLGMLYYSRPRAGHAVVVEGVDGRDQEAG
jgi:hypothetical protein